MAKKSSQALDRGMAAMVDKAAKDDWSGRVALVVVARDAGDGELEILMKEAEGDPYDTLLKLPSDDGYVVACLSSVGHQVDPDTGERMLIRSTVAVGRQSDFSILRYPSGSTRELVGVTGRIGDLLVAIVRSPSSVRSQLLL